MKDEKKKKKEVEVKIDLFSLEDEQVNEKQMRRIIGGLECGCVIDTSGGPMKKKSHHTGVPGN